MKAEEVSQGPGCAEDETTIPKAFRLSEYQYTLPSELIAQEPVARRDASRLLFCDRRTGKIKHCWFRDLPSLLHPSDILVLNETRVIPSVLIGNKPTGGRIEVLVLDPMDVTGKSTLAGHPVRESLVRNSRSLKQGLKIIIQQDVQLTVEESLGSGRVLVRFPVSAHDIPAFLDKWGHPPLPPYIRRMSRSYRSDRERYQTVYSRIPGSVAAPTAGLHFTEDLFSKLATRGIEVAKIVLHVGPGTFMPVRHKDVRQHLMESEAYKIPLETATMLKKARKCGRRIIAVGTTTVRALESGTKGDRALNLQPSMTNLFILPGHGFKVVQGMVTNFHLPGSTLLMLVCAFAGTERVLQCYEEAVREGYRFYSYGDACLII